MTTRSNARSGAIARLGAGVVIAAGLLLALTATIGPMPPAAGAPGASLAVEVSGAVRAVVLGLLALSAIILFSLLRRRRPTEGEAMRLRPPQRLPAWAQALVSLLPLLLVALAWYLVERRWADRDGQPVEGAFAAIAGLLDLLRHARKAPISVPLFDRAIATLLVLVSLAIFASMLLIAMAERLDKWRASRTAGAGGPAFPDARAETHVDLRSEPDPRRAIVRAYGRFERALAAARAPRAAWQTPAELMRSTLARLPVPARPVARLTALFEIARFSDRALGAEARDAACDCLDEITAALAEEAAREG